MGHTNISLVHLVLSWSCQVLPWSPKLLPGVPKNLPTALQHLSGKPRHLLRAPKQHLEHQSSHGSLSATSCSSQASHKGTQAHCITQNTLWRNKQTRRPRLLAPPDHVACSRLPLQCPLSPPFYNPDPSAPRQLLTHPQAELQALQLLLDREGDAPSSCPQPVLPKETASFHSNMLAMGGIPSCLLSAKQVIS